MEVKESNKILKDKFNQCKTQTNTNLPKEDLFNTFDVEFDLYPDLGTFLKDVLPNVDLSHLNKRFLNFRNHKDWFTVDKFFKEFSKDFFEESFKNFDENRIKWEIKDMLTHLLLEEFISEVDKIKLDYLKKDDNQEVKESINKINDFLDKIKNTDFIHKWLRNFLSKDFSLEDINIFSYQAYNFLNKLQDKTWKKFSLVWHWISGGIMIHLINMINFVLNNKLFDTYQVEIWESDKIWVIIWSYKKNPKNENLVLFDLRPDLLMLSNWILWTELEVGMYKNYGDSKIVANIAIIWNDKFNFDTDDINSGKFYLFMKERNCNHYFSNLQITDNILNNTKLDYIEQFIDYFLQTNVTEKKFFYSDIFELWKIGYYDTELILQDTRLLFWASWIIFNEIKKDLNLKNMNKLYINFVKDKEFSFIFMISLLLKRFYPNLDIKAKNEWTDEELENISAENFIDIWLKRNKLYEDMLWEQSPIMSLNYNFKYSYSIYSDKIKDFNW